MPRDAVIRVVRPCTQAWADYAEALRWAQVDRALGDDRNADARSTIRESNERAVEKRVRSGVEHCP